MREKSIRRMILTLAIASVLLTTAFYIFPLTTAATPTVNYISPSNNSEFIDVVPGEGVNYTVNVTDSDGNLERVVLQDNASGSWVTFYDSGSLGGVSYHNHSGTNSHWKGSWQRYYWKVCAYDGAWTNLTYSFTTEYVFGRPHLMFYNSTWGSIMGATIYKNNTNDYYFATHLIGSGKAYVIKSPNGMDWMVHDGEVVATGLDERSAQHLYSGVWSWFTFDNQPAFFYMDDKWKIAHYNGSNWAIDSTGIDDYEYHSNYERATSGGGCSIKYYNGEWHLVASRQVYSGGYQYASLALYKGTPWVTWSYILEFDRENDFWRYRDFSPKLDILDGNLILIYSNIGSDLRWWVYDGATWTNKNIIESDIWKAAGYDQITTCTMTKDVVNDQLVTFYVDGTTKDICYRVLSNISEGWSDEYIAWDNPDPTNITIFKLFAHYIDRRIILTFAIGFDTATNYWNPYSYSIYAISTPEYCEEISGITQTNRIQFPKSVPNQQHVNSTVFAIKNTGSRNILNITWHVGDLGEIQTANNVKVWSNMSGSWQGWLVGADHNTSKIDISALKGSKWQPGETTYWKLEILDIGNVNETTYISPNNIYYLVDLET